MRTIGLLGGMSWESTREYYRLLNEGVRDAKGGLHSASLLMHSFDFAEIASLQHSGQWDALGATLGRAARNMQEGGAEAVMICTNLMHKVAPAVQAAIDVPLLHIADAVGGAITAEGSRIVALLGAIYTMREPFYREYLGAHYGIEVLIPDEDEMHEVSRVVYEELCQGQFTESSRRRYNEIIGRLAQRGAQGVIMGCTEIPQLLRQEEISLPLYDTTALHVDRALEFMLRDCALKKAG